MLDDDVWHARVRDWFAAATDPCTLPATVVQETAYLVGVRRGPRAEAAFLRGVARGEFLLEPVAIEDLTRSAELVERYGDLPLGFVDASLVAVAERMDIASLLTTDRRHFHVVRPAHRNRLRLLP